MRRCLAKDPDQRYQNIKDVAIELKEVRREMQDSADRCDCAAGFVAGSEAANALAIRNHAGAIAIAQLRSPSSPSTRASSAEFIVNELKRHKIATIVGAVVVLIAGRCGRLAIRSYLHARSTEVAVESIAVIPFVNQKQGCEC